MSSTMGGTESVLENQPMDNVPEVEMPAPAKKFILPLYGNIDGPELRNLLIKIGTYIDHQTDADVDEKLTHLGAVRDQTFKALANVVSTIEASKLGHKDVLFNNILEKTKGMIDELLEIDPVRTRLSVEAFLKDRGSSAHILMEEKRARAVGYAMRSRGRGM